MKTIIFVLLTALTLTACAKDNKPAKAAPAPIAAAAFTNQAKAEDKKPAPRLHRMQLTAIAADKFILARKD